MVSRRTALNDNPVLFVNTLTSGLTPLTLPSRTAGLMEMGMKKKNFSHKYVFTAATVYNPGGFVHNGAILC